MPSDWKGSANQRRDARHMREGPESTGPRPKKHPSPKKREKLTPIWEVEARITGNAFVNHDYFAYVTAPTKDDAIAKARATWTHRPAATFRGYRLHQKDRALYGEVLDTDQWVTWSERLHLHLEQYHRKGTTNE